MERREHERLTSCLGANIYIDGHGKLRGQIRDVSQSGVSIILEQQITISSPESIIFLLADGMDQAYSLKFLRYEENIIALTFID